LVEVLLLVWVGKWLGLGPTLALVIVTGVLGASLARRQGFRVWGRIQRELREGRMPASDLIDGLLVLIGGIVLLTPGLITDGCGFALMIPGVRRWMRSRIEPRFSSMTQQRWSGPKEDVIDV